VAEGIVKAAVVSNTIIESMVIRVITLFFLNLITKAIVTSANNEREKVILYLFKPQWLVKEINF